MISSKSAHVKQEDLCPRAALVRLRQVQIGCTACAMCGGAAHWAGVGRAMLFSAGKGLENAAQTSVSSYLAYLYAF